VFKYKKTTVVSHKVVSFAVSVFKYKKTTVVSFSELLSKVNVHSTKKKITRLSMMLVGVQVYSLRIH
jgi:hypothetical protein